MDYNPNITYTQQYNVRIEYIYYEVIIRNELTESIKHAVRPDRIMEVLEDKNYTLRREDIIYLLKSDGAHFYEDSLRVYDHYEDNYFQVPEEWECALDEMESPDIYLIFWVRSLNQNFLRKFDELYEHFQALKDQLSERVEKLELETGDKLRKVYEDVERVERSAYSANLTPFVQLLPLNEKQSFDETSSSKSQRPEKSEQSGKSDILDPIDIALMYSEPLVINDGVGIISVGDPVNYEEECSKVLEILKRKEKRIKVQFEIATISQLMNVLSLSPRVLHIMCHGSYNKEKKQFYLAFEENRALSELYSENLKNRLKKIKFNTQLVFINACFSEEVARVFYDAGVPCVVAVHSQTKIEDSIAQQFSELFYWQLFEGKSIEDAFQNARAAITGKDVYTCCCAHSHKPDCKWNKIAQEEGPEKAHILHTPTCTNCRKITGNSFEHEDNCGWAFEFMCDYNLNYDFPNGKFRVCCCSPELEHNEVMKFQLIYRDRFNEQVLFRYKEEGTVSINKHSCIKPKFQIQKLTGRNLEVYQIIQHFVEKKKRVVNLHGPSGIGKTTLGKQVANHMIERGHFRDKVSTLMLVNTPSITHFRLNLCKEVPGSYDIKTFCESMKDKPMLFILEKCDKFISEHFEAFTQDLATIMEETYYVNFLIITTKEKIFNLGSRESQFQMKELRKIDAVKLLHQNAYMDLSPYLRNIYNLEEHGVFEYIDLTPQGIYALVEKLKTNSLDEIEAELEKERRGERSGFSETEETITKKIE